jgi:uncharacterized membrane protein
MDLMQFLVVLVCGGGLLLIIALGAWVLINKSKLEQPSANQQSRLDELDRRYAAGDLDESEYDAERQKILRMGR